MQTVFNKSQKGQKAWSLPKNSDRWAHFTPPQETCKKAPLGLPELSEIDLTRHFSQLSKRTMGIDNTFYPLGSCTMKFNPRVNELAAALPGFARSHPLAPDETVQGNLKIIHDLIALLCEVGGMDGGTLLPNAGAQGEFTGVRMIEAYHKNRGDNARNEMLIPDNAHGTNPATAAMAGLKAVTLRTDASGDMDLDHLREMASERTAGLMLTNPNTLGLFSPKVLEVTKIVHDAGGLLYYDGANLNAIMEIVKPGDMGFDVMHINLHKTFSTPHGGGGPGSGPVLCKSKLKEFLPLPRVVKEGNSYKSVWNDRKSIGHMTTFYGNFGIYLRAYLYARLHGHYGLRRIAEQAVVNANYVKKGVEGLFTIPYPQYCMHEFVIQADNYLSKGVKALDIAKRLLDYGVHSPTIYFPLIVKECMLIEPTEGESKTTLDHFIHALKSIVEEIKKNPDLVKTAPHSTPLSRLDEVQAARHPILRTGS